MGSYVGGWSPGRPKAMIRSLEFSGQQPPPPNSSEREEGLETELMVDYVCVRKAQYNHSSTEFRGKYMPVPGG